MRRFFYFHAGRKVTGGNFTGCPVSISFAEIFLFPHGHGFFPHFHPPYGSFNLLCGDFFISTCAQDFARKNDLSLVSISFAEIFLFPQGKRRASDQMGSPCFNLLCGDFFISTRRNHNHPASLSSVFQSPLRRFFYFHSDSRFTPGSPFSSGFNLLCGDFFISTWKERPE